MLLSLIFVNHFLSLRKRIHKRRENEMRVNGKFGFHKFQKKNVIINEMQIFRSVALRNDFKRKRKHNQ